MSRALQAIYLRCLRTAEKSLPILNGSIEVFNRPRHREHDAAVLFYRNLGYASELEEARLPHKLEELASCPPEDIVRALRRDHRRESSLSSS